MTATLTAMPSNDWPGYEGIAPIDCDVHNSPGARLREFIIEYSETLARPNPLDLLLPLGWPTPQDFARALIELYQSEELWKRLSQNGINKTQELYSTEAAREKLEFLFSDRHLRSLEPSQPVAEHELVGSS